MGVRAVPAAVGSPDRSWKAPHTAVKNSSTALCDAALSIISRCSRTARRHRPGPQGLDWSLGAAAAAASYPHIKLQRRASARLPHANQGPSVAVKAPVSALSGTADGGGIEGLTLPRPLAAGALELIERLPGFCEWPVLPAARRAGRRAASCSSRYEGRSRCFVPVRHKGGL